MYSACNSVELAFHKVCFSVDLCQLPFTCTFGAWVTHTCWAKNATDTKQTGNALLDSKLCRHGRPTWQNAIKTNQSISLLFCPIFAARTCPHNRQLSIQHNQKCQLNTHWATACLWPRAYFQPNCKHSPFVDQQFNSLMLPHYWSVPPLHGSSTVFYIVTIWKENKVSNNNWNLV